MSCLAVRAISAFSVVAFAYAEQPLDQLKGDPVTKVSLRAYLKGKPKIERDINNQEDIRFILDHLKGLKSKYYDHSFPQIDITLYTSSNKSVRLRVSEHEIGPDAPASANIRHWFPKDSTLFDFLVSKAYSQPAV